MNAQAVPNGEQNAKKPPTPKLMKTEIEAPEPPHDSRAAGGRLHQPCSGIVTVASDKTFGWKPPCPYCGGKITFRASGWVEEADGTWTATDGDIECSTEPDIDSRVWQEWSDNHGGYDWGDKWHQLQERIIAALRRKVRFTFQNAEVCQPEGAKKL